MGRRGHENEDRDDCMPADGIGHVADNADRDRDPLPDEAVADWFVRRIGELAKERNGKPFFMGCGFIRPHTPLYAPKRFFDMYPVETVRLPRILPGDRSDTHFHDYLRKGSKGPRYFELLGQSYPSLKEGLRHYLQAYLACVAFVDEQVGKVVNAVDRGPFKDNTIIVLASDHGYNHVRRTSSSRTRRGKRVFASH